LPTDVTAIAMAPANPPSNILQGLVTSEGSKDLIDGELIRHINLSGLAAQLGNGSIRLGTETAGNVIDIDQGNLLLAPDQDVVVKTHEGTLHVAHGSIAIVMESGHDVSVFDLHDAHPHAVRFMVGKRVITLFPGRQLVLTRQENPSFDSVNPSPLIPTRHPSCSKIDGITAYIAEFSIPAAASRFIPLIDLMRAGTPDNKRMADSICKTSAILAQLSGRGGIYSTAHSNVNTNQTETKERTGTGNHATEGTREPARTEPGDLTNPKPIPAETNTSEPGLETETTTSPPDMGMPNETNVSPDTGGEER
jgi:hypothetical protein